MRILILGGTAEARQLAGRLAGRANIEVTLSLADKLDTIVGLFAAGLSKEWRSGRRDKAANATIDMM